MSTFLRWSSTGKCADCGVPFDELRKKYSLRAANVLRQQRYTFVMTRCRRCWMVYFGKMTLLGYKVPVIHFIERKKRNRTPGT